MKRSIIMLMVVALLLSSFSGISFAQTKITFATWPAVDESIERMLPMFNELYPDIEVEVISAGFGDHHTALINDLAAGAPLPDVSMIEIGYIGRFTASGGFVDLLQEPFNAGQFEELIVPYKWAQGTTDDGRLIAMPKDIAPASVFYRRDKFEAAGLPTEPEEVEALFSTWEGFLEVSRQLTRDTTGDGNIDHWAMANASEIATFFLNSDAVRYFDEDGRPVLNRPHLVEGLSLAKQFREEGLDARIGAWSTEWYEAIERGTTAMLLTGAWMGGHIRGWMAPDTGGLWGITHLPGGIYANMGGSFMAIPESSQNKEAAWKLIEFIATSPEAQLFLFEDGDIFPALLGTYDDEVFEAEIDFYAGQQARLTWIEAALNVPSVSINRFDPIADELFGQAVTMVLQEGADPQRALDDANAQLQRRAR